MSNLPPDTYDPSGEASGAQLRALLRTEHSLDQLAADRHTTAEAVNEAADRLTAPRPGQIKTLGVEAHSSGFSLATLHPTETERDVTLITAVWQQGAAPTLGTLLTCSVYATPAGPTFDTRAAYPNAIPPDWQHVVSSETSTITLGAQATLPDVNLAMGSVGFRLPAGRALAVICDPAPIQVIAAVFDA